MDALPVAWLVGIPPRWEKSMKSSNTTLNDYGVIARLESKAEELEIYAQTTTSRIVRAVSQGQAEILREFAEVLANELDL